MSVRRRRPLLVSAVLVAGAGLALTACGPDNADSAGGTTAASPATVAAAPSRAGSPTAGAPAAGAPATGAASPTAPHAARTPSGASPSSSARPDGGSAAAGAHPCDIGNLSIHVTARAGAPSQRVIEVHNTGATACSLSSTPGVDLGNSTARDQSNNIKPILASGTLRFPVPAGQSAYAVIDLDPSGATTGTAPGINELNVLVDDEGTNMPLANTRNFPLNGDARVLNPQMGIYRASVAEAVASMAAASK